MAGSRATDRHPAAKRVWPRKRDCGSPLQFSVETSPFRSLYNNERNFIAGRDPTFNAFNAFGDKATAIHVRRSDKTGPRLVLSWASFVLGASVSVMKWYESTRPTTKKQREPHCARSPSQ